MNSILITGCSSGIGLETAHLLKQKGYEVFATARKETDVIKLKQQGFKSYVLDVTDDSTIDHVLENILEITGGTLDALFNNAGFGQPGALEDISTSVLKEQFETNVFGLHALTYRVLSIMRRQGYGKIIQHSSVLGLVSLKYRGAYNASKYAVEGLTDTLRLELHGSGIFVSLLNTGPVISEFRNNALKMFEKNVDQEKSLFKKDYSHHFNPNKNQKAPFTLEGSSVAYVVLGIMNSPSPKPRYYITKATYLLGYLKRMLPTAWLDKLLMKVS